MFRRLIEHQFQFLPVEQRALFVSSNALKIFEQAFTHSSFDPISNYEILEQFGDLTINKFLVSYFYERFPALYIPDGVKVVARLRIRYGSKQILSRLSEEHGFFPHIRVNPDYLTTNMKRYALLEDVFEAFVGATERIGDMENGRGYGWGVCYGLLKQVYDQEDVSLKYDDLFDAKTRVKEITDYFKTMGSIVFRYNKELMCHEVLWRGRLIGSAQSANEASAQALTELKKNGFYREVPVEFSKFENIESIVGDRQ